MDTKNTKAKNQKSFFASVCSGSVSSREKAILKLLFVLFCCFMGLFSKRIINPLANTITGSLHIPGGISTSFSLMFLVIAAGVINKRWCAVFMGTVQAITAFSTGMIGSMGVFMPVAYIVPALVIDLVMLFPVRKKQGMAMKLFIASILASAAAALIADYLVFRLPKMIMLVYFCTAATSGAVCGYIAAEVSVSLNKNEVFGEKDR